MFDLRSVNMSLPEIYRHVYLLCTTGLEPDISVPYLSAKSRANTCLVEFIQVYSPLAWIPIVTYPRSSESRKTNEQTEKRV